MKNWIRSPVPACGSRGPSSALSGDADVQVLELERLGLLGDDRRPCRSPSCLAGVGVLQLLLRRARPRAALTNSRNWRGDLLAVRLVDLLLLPVDLLLLVLGHAALAAEPLRGDDDAFDARRALPANRSSRPRRPGRRSRAGASLPASVRSRLLGDTLPTRMSPGPTYVPMLDDAVLVEVATAPWARRWGCRG